MKKEREYLHSVWDGKISTPFLESNLIIYVMSSIVEDLVNYAFCLPSTLPWERFL